MENSGEWPLLDAPRREVAEECEEAREAERRVDVAFEDVEGEVVEAAEGPDGDGEEDGEFECGAVEHEKNGGEQAQEQEEESFGFDPVRVSEVAHGESVRLGGGSGNGLSEARA